LIKQVKGKWWQLLRTPMDVVYTDNIKSALIFQCKNYFLFHFKDTWIASRTPQMENVVLIQLKNMAVEQKLIKNATMLQTTPQYNCMGLTC
jgi:hypothetical protein